MSCTWQICRVGIIETNTGFDGEIVNKKKFINNLNILNLITWLISFFKCILRKSKFKRKLESEWVREVLWFSDRLNENPKIKILKINQNVLSINIKK